MTKKKLLACIILLTCVFTLAKAQTSRPDSLKRIVSRHSGDTAEVKTLLLLGVEYSADDLQTSQNYFQQALRLAEKIKDAELIAESYVELGRIYHADGKSDSALLFNRKALAIAPAKSPYKVEAHQGIALNQLWLSQKDSAKIYLQKGLSIAQEIFDYKLQAGLYNELGNVALQDNDRLEALRYYVLSAKLQDSLLHEPVGLARALLNIGNIQFQLKNIEKAIQYTTEAKEIAEKNNYDKGVAYAFQQMGRIYRSQKKFDDALIQFEKAREIYRRMGDKRSAAETELSIGNVYFDKSDFKKAQFHHVSALIEGKSISNQTLKMYTYNALGYDYQALKQYEKAAMYADSSRAEGKAMNHQYGVLDAYTLLMEIHRDQNHYKEAYEYSNLLSYLNDSLTRAENSIEAEELEVKYQNEKKVAEIELLKSDKNLQEAIISRQQTIQIATVVILVMVIVIALILINRYRAVNEARRMIEIERVRNTIARDLHDDIGSTLSSINILSKVAMLEKNGSTENYLQRISDQSERMMEEISDIVWSIDPHHDTMSEAVIRMREFSTELFEPTKISWNFSEEIDADLKLDADRRKSLFLIFKESLNNAAKYSEATQINITLRKEAQTLVMNVKDNGKGFDESIVKAGNGLRNVRERAREVKGILAVVSAVGKGTEIELRIPVA